MRECRSFQDYPIHVPDNRIWHAKRNRRYLTASIIFLLLSALVIGIWLWRPLAVAAAYAGILGLWICFFKGAKGPR